MAYFARQIESCPHRQCGEEHGSTTPDQCGLLIQIAGESGVQDREVSAVSTPVCQNCCRWFVPTSRDWNPVIASLVLDRISNGESLAMESKREDAMTVHYRAIAAIPILADFPRDEIPEETAPVSTPTADELEATVPLPAWSGRSNSNVARSWMVGITTAPRRHPTLRHCLDALQRAGWSQAHVFADGGSPAIAVDDAKTMEVTVVQRGTCVGGWSNFVLSAQELVHRNPGADAYMMLQDDALLARFPALREYVDRLMDRVGGDAIVSLYSCAADTQSRTGWHRAREPVQRGAQGFVFGREAMRRFLADSITRPWELAAFHRGKGRLEQRGIDGNVGRWAAYSQTPLWLPTPSLIWHLGETSTLWPGAAMLGIRRAGSFLETRFAMG